MANAVKSICETFENEYIVEQVTSKTKTNTVKPHLKSRFEMSFWNLKLQT